MNFKIGLISVLMVMVVGSTASSQVAIKTNLLYDATANLNLGIEIGVGRKWSAELIGSCNFWKFSDQKQWRNYLVQPEVRYWFCNRFTGHFVGFHLHGGQYNIGNTDMNFKLFGTDFSRLRDKRAQGWFAGAGIAYGYDWILGKHWNIEAELGVGYAYSRYDLFPCAVCGTKLESNHPHNYYGITRAAINIVYLF